MATVESFRAWHYEPHQVSLERVVAPPYDVISRTYQEELYARDSHNVIRLILGQATPEEIKQDERYEAARKHLEAWTKENVLVRDQTPAYYLQETTYSHPYRNTKLTRLALFGRLKLEAFGSGSVYPHEKTHASAKEDRMKLLRATHTNFSPIFLIHQDSEGKVDKIRKQLQGEIPLFDFSDDQGAAHRVWAVSATNAIQNVAGLFRDQKVFIADGHHRYETALRFASETWVSQKSGGNYARGCDYVMSAFVRFSDPGLLILPIHRIVLPSVSFDQMQLIEALKRNFILHSVTRSVLEKISEGTAQDGFGLAFSEDECYVLELKDQMAAQRQMPEGRARAWYGLDVNLVSYLILEPLLGIQSAHLEKSVRYSPSSEEVFNALKKKEAALAFLIRPTNVERIKEICESGELMPQKSTYFYPKFSSGLLMYRHSAENRTDSSSGEEHA